MTVDDLELYNQHNIVNQLYIYIYTHINIYTHIYVLYIFFPLGPPATQRHKYIKNA